MTGNGKWRKIQHTLEMIDYPAEEIGKHGGIPPDYCYGYVSSSFLNGLVNYVTEKRVFIINRYGLEPKDQNSSKYPPLDTAAVTKKYQELADKMAETHHPRLGTTDSDDAILFGTTEDCYWIFWFDCDCSDCFIWRIYKETAECTYEQLIELFLQDLKDRYSDWQHVWTYPEAVIVEIPKVSGWISS
jgi:hypothetical protein